MLIYVVLLVVLLVLILLLRLARSTGKAGEGSNWTFKVDSVPTVLTTALDSLGMPTKIVFNGQEYSTPDEMPPDAREAYDLAMRSMHANSDREGLPDLLKSAGRIGAAPSSLTPGGGAGSDPAARLKQLQEMKNSGLITSEEYEAKRTQILDRI